MLQLPGQNRQGSVRSPLDRQDLTIIMMLTYVMRVCGLYVYTFYGYKVISLEGIQDFVKGLGVSVDGVAYVYN